MMKKIIVATVLMLGFQMSQAQTVDGLFREFADEENATCVKVPWLPIRLIGLFADDEDRQLVKRISSIRVLELSDCTGEVQTRFAAKVQKLKMRGYEPLLTVIDDGSHVRMWGKMKDEVIKELVIGVSGDDEATLCHIKGNLNMEDIDFAISDNSLKLSSSK